jgi:hypothetical protein
VKNPKRIDLIIEALEDELLMSEVDEDYRKNVQSLGELNAIRKGRRWVPSPEVVIGAVVSLTSVLMILNFEKEDIINTKSLGFIKRF